MADRYFWWFFFAAVCSLITAYVVSEQGISASRSLLREQARLAREHDARVEAEVRRLREELADAEAEARCYRELAESRR